MPAEDKSSEGFAQRISLAKDVFSLLRDVVLFLAIAMLLIFPITLKKTLNAAGIVELNTGFAVWKSSLGATDQDLKVANDTITSLRAQQDELLKTIAGLKVSAEQEKAIAAATNSAQTTDVAAQQVQAKVKATLQSNASLIAGDTAPVAAAPTAAPNVCYQERDPGKPPAQLYSVHCHRTKELCETARGPNPRTQQTACVSVAIGNAQWSPTRGGFLGAWYAFQSEPFPAPFPALPAR